MKSISDLLGYEPKLKKIIEEKLVVPIENIYKSPISKCLEEYLEKKIKRQHISSVRQELTKLLKESQSANYDQLHSEILEKRLLCTADIETLEKNLKEIDRLVEAKKKQDDEKYTQFCSFRMTVKIH